MPPEGCRRPQRLDCTQQQISCRDACLPGVASVPRRHQQGSNFTSQALSGFLVDLMIVTQSSINLSNFPKSFTTQMQSPRSLSRSQVWEPHQSVGILRFCCFDNGLVSSICQTLSTHSKMLPKFTWSAKMRQTYHFQTVKQLLDLGKEHRVLCMTSASSSHFITILLLLISPSLFPTSRSVVCRAYFPWAISLGLLLLLRLRLALSV